MLSLSSVLFVALLVYLFELGNWYFFKGIATYLGLYKMSETAVTLPAMSEANILHVIHS